MGNEHFGWPEFYEDPDGYFGGIDAERKADAQLRQKNLRRVRDQLWSKRLSGELIQLAQQGIESVKGLSYAKIAFLEAWLGMLEGDTPEERYHSLLRAIERDKERKCA